MTNQSLPKGVTQSEMTHVLDGYPVEHRKSIEQAIGLVAPEIEEQVREELREAFVKEIKRLNMGAEALYVKGSGRADAVQGEANALQRGIDFLIAITDAKVE